LNFVSGEEPNIVIKVIMGVACSTHERNEKCVQEFYRETWRTSA